MGVERLIRDLKDADERLARRSSAGAGSRRGGDGTQRPVAAMRPWPIQAAAFSLVLFLVLGIGAGALWFFEYSPAAAGDGPAASSQPPGGPVTAPLTSTPTPTPTQRPTPTPRLREPVEVGLPQPPIVAVPPPPLSTPPVAIATALPLIRAVPTPALSLLRPVVIPTLIRAVPIPDLRTHALGLINQDRADHGLAPVVLGTNPAAQMHAYDMLEHSYLGHWWVDGRKPYMVYTQTGGTSYAGENAAFSGWTDREWSAANCDSPRVRCDTVTDPAGSITEHQYRMMYDDAHADWGHRDNILGEGHRVVNLGIAFNGRRLTFVQHFEGGAVIAPSPPALWSGGRLHLELVKQEPGVPIWPVIGIYYDPPPVPRTPEAIGRLSSYCLGGGFTDDCGGIEALVWILEPPGAGYYYSDLAPNDVVADIRWEETIHDFTLTASMGTWLEEPGVYTVVTWRDRGNAGGEILTELSLFVE